MAKLVTLLEQHLDGLLPTVVIQATIWWEAVVLLSHVKLQECGLGVHLPESMLLLPCICVCTRRGQAHYPTVCTLRSMTVQAVILVTDTRLIVPSSDLLLFSCTI